MERIPEAVYTPEFRAEAVKLVEAEGLPIGQAAKRLSLPKASPSDWVGASRRASWRRWARARSCRASWRWHWRAHTRSWRK